jgi:hypothetical protein
MPTKRQRRPQARRLIDLPGDLVEYLTLGQYNGNGGGAFDTFQIAGGVLRGNFARIRELWSDHGEAILEEWIDEHPGSRPFAWWVCVAPAPRLVLYGAELTLANANHKAFGENEVWRRHFGIPAFIPCRPRDFDGWPSVESQASYLDRHHLLAAEERAALEDDDFEDEEINPFVTAEDLRP